MVVGEGRVVPTLPGEGGSKTPFSLVFPPCGTQSTRDVLSGERHQQCQLSGTLQVSRGKRFGDAAGKIHLALLVQVHVFNLTN